MRNNKGFTLTEVLLAVMIVGLIGVTLAALTGTASRESSVGRTRMMLRNQVSAALRQLRQDVHLSSGITTCGSSGWTLQQESGKKIGPDHTPTTITYSVSSCSNGICKITRKVGSSAAEDWLQYVRQVSVNINGTVFSAPKCELAYPADNPAPPVNSVMKLTLVVGVDSEPPVAETVEEIFMLPHGFSTTD